MAAGEAAAGGGLLTFKFDNKAPVALEDLTASLNALAQSYEDYLVATGEALPEAGVKLYVHDLRTGSITAVLQAIADQGHLLFGERGVVPAVQSAFEHADTIGGFIVSLNDVIQFFLGNRDKKEPSKKEADQIVKILEPVARTTAANLALDLMVQSHLTPLRSSARFTFTTTAKKRTQCRTTRGVISGRRCRQNSRHAG